MSLQDDNAYGATLSEEIWRRMRIAQINTQKELAKKTKLNTSTISNIMSGKTAFGDDHINALIPVLGGSFEEWEQYKKKGEDTQIVNDDNLRKAFLEGKMKVKVQSKTGVQLEFPAFYDPRDTEATANYVADLVQKLKDQGLDFDLI